MPFLFCHCNSGQRQSWKMADQQETTNPLDNIQASIVASTWLLPPMTFMDLEPNDLHGGRRQTCAVFMEKSVQERSARTPYYCPGARNNTGAYHSCSETTSEQMAKGNPIRGYSQPRHACFDSAQQCLYLSWMCGCLQQCLNPANLHSLHRNANQSGPQLTQPPLPFSLMHNADSLSFPSMLQNPIDPNISMVRGTIHFVSFCFFQGTLQNYTQPSAYFVPYDRGRSSNWRNAGQTTKVLSPSGRPRRSHSVRRGRTVGMR